MSALLDLARPEIRALKAYRAAGYAEGLIRLNANETPWPPPGDQHDLNRYPAERPVALTRRLAERYAVSSDQLLVTRGSSEAIDVLIRGFCRAGQDGIVICPPTFGMYRVYADIQGATVREVPLITEQGFALDVDRIVDGWRPESKLLFVCSPNNPTGNRIPDAQLEQLCDALCDRALVVVDGAYAEFADTDPTDLLLDRYPNAVVLRTLSKAYGLAGIRCGVLLAQPEIVTLLGPVLPPYAFPTPSQEAALACLADDNYAEIAGRLETLRVERRRVAEALTGLESIRQVWPSEANFLLVEATDPERTVRAARDGGILIRDFSGDPGLGACLRITVGEPAQNDQLIESLRANERG